MQVLRILKAMGFKNGKEALGLLRSMKKSGCKEINIIDSTRNSFRVNCTIPDSGNQSSFLFDFAKNRQTQTTKFSSRALLPWDRIHNSTVTEIGNLTTGRHLKTITKTQTLDNGSQTLERTVVKNHVTGTTLERRITPDGRIEYFRQRQGGQNEKLFA